ncbi:Rha family transcriptional regulator [Bacillaceae bacterium Marseille-Q3522]|nr:Rha family transcriptional regulator [Bacillaceae bacterium Marseille-Q3522]
METNNLVYQKDSNIVTDSLTIAEVFEKRHDKVLRDIKNLSCSKEFKMLNFGESTYVNKQGRKMPCYVIKENGFYILAMGYTGEKAMQFKERYINEFQRMRSILESQKKQQFLLGESQTSILSKQQKEIQIAVHDRILSLYPNVRDSGRRKYYAKIYQQLKAKFKVDSYRDLQAADFEKALLFIKERDSPKLAGGIKK